MRRTLYEAARQSVPEPRDCRNSAETEAETVASRSVIDESPMVYDSDDDEHPLFIMLCDPEKGADIK